MSSTRWRRTEAPAEVRRARRARPAPPRVPSRSTGERVGDLGAREACASVGRRRLGFDERAQRVDHLRRTRAKVSQQLLHPGHPTSILSARAACHSVSKPNFRRRSCDSGPCRGVRRVERSEMAGTELDLAPTTRDLREQAAAAARRAAERAGIVVRTARHARRARRGLAPDRAHLGRRTATRRRRRACCERSSTPGTSSPARSTATDSSASRSGSSASTAAELHLHSHITGVDRASRAARSASR